MRETVFVRPSAWRLGAVMLVAVVLALAGAVMIGGRAAEAHDHQVPNTVLKKGERNLQVGRRVFESSWDQPAGNDECVNQNAIYVTDFPAEDRVAAGSKLRVRILKSQRPDSFGVVAYPKVDREGEPAGQGRQLESNLRRVVVDERTVAWDAVFWVNQPARDYYLIAEGHWQDTEGCGNDQFAFWSFHIKTRVA